MKRTFFLKAIGGIDEDLIIEASAENDENKANAENKSRFLPYRVAGTAAACLVLAAGVWIAAQSGFVKMATDNAAPEAECAPDMSPAEDGVGGVMDGAAEMENLTKGEAADAAGSTGSVKAAKTAVNEFLSEEGSSVRCLSVTVELAEGEQIAVVVLTGNPGEEAVRGLAALVRDVTRASCVRIILSDGGELAVPGQEADQ